MSPAEDYYSSSSSPYLSSVTRTRSFYSLLERSAGLISPRSHLHADRRRCEGSPVKQTFDERRKS